MEFEEIEDMARICIENQYKKSKIPPDLKEIKKQILKKIKKDTNNIKELEENLSFSIILLMFLAYKHKIDLESPLLNKIEEISKTFK